jgi:hypothetical protein
LGISRNVSFSVDPGSRGQIQSAARPPKNFPEINLSSNCLEMSCFRPAVAFGRPVRRRALMAQSVTNRLLLVSQNGIGLSG